MQRSIAFFLLLAGVCLAEIQLPSHPNNLDDVPAVKERCEKKGNADTYQKLKQAMTDTRSCLEGKIDPAKVKDELEEAKKTGSMDEVFGKYCNKRPEYKDCIMKTVNATKECLEENEIKALDTAIKVVEEIAEFACYRDGDRLAMFVAEGGMTCVSSRTDQIQNCINSTLKIDTSNLSLESLPTSLPSIEIDKKKCDDLAKVQECVVNDLENNCKDTTPANIVDALFRFIKKSTCKKISKRSATSRKHTRDLLWQHNMVNNSLIEETFKEECKQNGGDVNSLLDSLTSTKLCLQKAKFFVVSKEKYLSNFRNCTKDFITKVEACLPEESKYYPLLFANGVESLVDFAYDHLNLHKMSPTSEVVNCLQRIKYSSGGVLENLKLCLPKNITDNNFSIPNKTEICKQWIQFDDCFKNFVKKTCIPDITIDQIMGNFTEASLKPCQSIR